VSLEPRTAFLSLDEHPTLSECRNDNRFSVTLVESTAPMPDEIRKSSTVSALLVSLSLCSLAAEHFRLSVDGKIVPTRRVPAFRASVIDLAAEPSIWVGSPLRFVHFHVRRAGIDDVAADLGYDRVGGVRLAVVEPDIVLAQITRSMLPHLGGATGPSPIALDHLELILDAHLLQHYAGVRQIRAATAVGLVASQRRRAEEILRANLDGRVRLSDMARECGLSVSHFARSFKTSFGVPCHRWLLLRRIERAQDLLLRTDAPLGEIAIQSGFREQAAFTRTFRRIVGMTPGSWRRERKRD